jgi:dihydroorotate dehydrogenase electron transfer subunit
MRAARERFHIEHQPRIAHHARRAGGVAIPAGVGEMATHSVALLERWGVPSRLASNAGIAGAHRGFITDLARGWLATLAAKELRETQVFACGPTPMLKAVAKLARELNLPCQVALEEYMACGIGGCAGCTVLLQTPDGPAMKRVCVDGPVFDAQQVSYLAG